MLEHNRHHADELREMHDRLSASGKLEAATKLQTAISCFESGNKELEGVIELLK